MTWWVYSKMWQNSTTFSLCSNIVLLMRYCSLHFHKTQMSIMDDMYGLLARYVKLRFAHAPGMPGTFSPTPRVRDPDMHHGTCVTHVPWCMSGSLTSGFLWNRWWGKRSRHYRRMHNPQFYISGKRPMVRQVAVQSLLSNHIVFGNVT